MVADTAEGDLFRITREADLKRHLTNDRSKEPEILEKDKNEEPLANPEKIFQFGTPEDFQLQQAVNFIDGKPIQKAVPRPKSTKIDAAGSTTNGK